MRRAVLTAVTALLLVLTFGSFTSANAATGPDTGAEGDYVARTNAARASSGLGSLRVAGDLVDLARRHSAEMANSNSLYHTANLGDVVQNWLKVGENVGHGSDVATIQNAFMASQHHRDNILDPAFTETGVGVVWQGDMQYVTVLFRKPARTYAAAAPKPAAPTRTATPVRTATHAPVVAPPPPPAPVIPPAPYATEGLPTVDVPFFAAPPEPPASAMPSRVILATSRRGPTDEKHVNATVQLLRLAAVAAVGLTAASWYHRRPQLRQRISIRTVSI